MKKVLAILMALTMVLAGTAAMAEKTPALVYESTPVSVEAFSDGGHILLALKDLETVFGVVVTEKDGGYTMDNGLNSATFKVGANDCTIVNLVENGAEEALELDAAPVESDGKVYVPAELLRAVLGEDAVRIEADGVVVRSDGYFINGMPNPMEEQDSLDALSEKVGFAVAAPETLGAFKLAKLYSIDGMAQVIYENGDQELCYRISAAADGDNSGDYSEYSSVKAEKIGEANVTLKGSDSEVNLAIWTQNGYDYSVGIREKGVSADEMASILNALGI